MGGSLWGGRADLNQLKFAPPSSTMQVVAVGSEPSRSQKTPKVKRERHEFLGILAQPGCYDLHIHQAVSHLRRLDGKIKLSDGTPQFNWGAQKSRKYEVKKSQPVFGWWTFYLLDKVVCPYLAKTYGSIFKVNTASSLRRLLEEKVRM